MALDYTEHTWGYGEEFTPDKLNNMEHGIKEASDAVNEVNNNFYMSSNMSSSESEVYTVRTLDGKKIYRSTVSIMVSENEWKFEQVIGNSPITTSGTWIDAEHSFFIGTNYTKPVVYYENNGYSNWVRVKNGTNKVDVYSEESGTFFISILFTLD